MDNQMNHYEKALASATNALQLAYTKYKKSVIEYYISTWYDMDGNFCVDGDYANYIKNIKDTERQVDRCVKVLNEMKKEINNINLSN